MPRIPSDGFYADSSASVALNPVRGMSPAEAALPGQQLQEFGDALTGAGTQAMRIATDMQEHVNQVALMDAMNKARASALDLTYNTQTGYEAIKGEAALKRPEGASLPDEFAGKLEKSIGEISAGLGNERQRLDFQLRANEMVTSFRGQVASHLEREFQSHALSVADGTLKLSADDAKRNWNDPEKVAVNVLQAKAAVVRAGQIRGESATEIEAKTRLATSNVHAGVIGAALESNNPSYAVRYLQKYSGEMTADDLLKANGIITRTMDSAQARQAVDQTTRQFAADLQPTEKDRAFRILIGTESRGRQFDKYGQPLASPTGAIGIAQVMPKTAPEAARLAGLPWDEERYRTDAKYNMALGAAYFEKQLQTFGGNLPMAYAAYNAGPGALKTAMKVASAAGKPEQWLSLMPNETQDYVRKNMKEYEAGTSADSMPSMLTFVNNALDRLGANPRPEVAQLTRQAAEHQYRLIEQDQKDRKEAVIANTMRELEKNGGRYSELPASLLSHIPPDKRDDMRNYGSRVSKGDDVTAPAVYLKLVDDNYLKGLSDNAFYALRGELSESDFKHFAKARETLRSGKEKANTAGDLNTGAINAVLSDRLRMMGRDPTPKEGSREAQLIGAMHKTIRESILNAQAATGKKMTDDEVEKHVDGLFAKSASFRSTFLGMPYGDVKSQQLFGMTPGDIPSDVREKLKADFAARGIKPTEADYLGAYWKAKLASR